MLSLLWPSFVTFSGAVIGQYLLADTNQNNPVSLAWLAALAILGCIDGATVRWRSVDNPGRAFGLWGKSSLLMTASVVLSICWSLHEVSGNLPEALLQASLMGGLMTIITFVLLSMYIGNSQFKRPANP